MSSELERLLREARNALPDPDAGATRVARERALSALRRRRRPRTRRGVMVTIALVVAVALGVGVGSLIAPGTNAAQGPTGVGFLPVPGWFVLQSGAGASESRPAVAMASNVPFARQDDARGLAESSALPYQSLLRLPANGVILVAVVLPHREPPAWMRSSRFHEASLPLRVRDAYPYTQSSTQVRPEAPLGQYQLRALVNGHDVDLTIYFGRQRPTAAQRSAAQRQLSQLVVLAEPLSEPAQASRLQAPASTSRPSGPSAIRINRNLLCTTLLTGGIREIEVRARSGVKQRSTWSVLPDAIVATGAVTSPQNAMDDALVWVTAGKPSSDTMIGDEYYRTPVTAVGTLGISASLCKAVRAKIPLNAKGLRRGGAASQLGEKLDCATPRRVLVRIRATLAASSQLRRRDGFLRIGVPVVSGQIAVRTQSGKPLVYASVADTGKTRLFTARSCQLD